MTDKKKIEILCFLDDDYGRDVEILMPVVYYAEKILHCTVKFAFVWDIHAIYRRRPDVVLLANTIGSKLYFEISKYAHRNGIKVFALISEGNFSTTGTVNYYGFNTDRKFYQEYICLWNERTYKFMKKELADDSGKCVLTGSTGFDRYRIYRFKSKEEYLKEKNIANFTKVIGYAGWAFGKLTNVGGRKELRVDENKDSERFKWMEKMMYFVEGVLKKAVLNNPDILFIFKRHPNEIHPHITKEGLNEMIRLREFPNVLYIKENENLHDIINACDIWLGFRSTTVLEAWGLKPIPTLLINPDLAYKYESIFDGCLIVDTYEDLQNAIDEFYTTGGIAAFEQKQIKESQKRLFREIIGWDDGLNHVRTGYYLKKVIDGIQPGTPKKVKLNFSHFLKYFLLHAGKYFYHKGLFLKLPKFRKTIWIFERFRLEGLEKLKNTYFGYLNSFYEKQDLKNKIENKAFWDNLFSY